MDRWEDFKDPARTGKPVILFGMCVPNALPGMSATSADKTVKDPIARPVLPSSPSSLPCVQAMLQPTTTLFVAAWTINYRHIISSQMMDPVLALFQACYLPSWGGSDSLLMLGPFTPHFPCECCVQDSRVG